ncbi:MAG: hypothetical protein ABI616_00945 [Pseudomonadota bacterium]
MNAIATQGIFTTLPLQSRWRETPASNPHLKGSHLRGVPSHLQRGLQGEAPIFDYRRNLAGKIARMLES